MARNFFREIAALTRAGDLDGLSAIAMELAGLAQRDEDRRALQAAKKRERRVKRPRTVADVPGQAVLSMDRGGHPPMVSLLSPTPPNNSSFPPVASAATNGASAETPIQPPSEEPVDAVVGETRDDLTSYAIGITTAANNTIAARWGEQPVPIRWDHPLTLQLAEDLVGKGVPLALARSAIAAVIRKTKLPEPFKALSYFRGPILEAWSAAKQRDMNRADQAPPKPTAAEDAARAERDLEAARTAYDCARRDAVRAWRQDPAHAAELAEIEREADQRFAHMTHTFEGRSDRLTFLSSESARAAGFPAFDEWRAAQRAPPAVASG